MRQLGVFARYWEAGRVKTRLAATVGDRRAADLYRAFLQTVLTRFGRLQIAAAEEDDAGTNLRRVLAFEPANRREDFARLAGDHWELELQAAGDLGMRMRTWFENAFASGAQQVVLIGSDAPTLPAERVVEAFAALRRVAVVLGPADDGGYYLVGAREQTPDIFGQIAWGSADVWDQTRRQLKASSTTFAALDPWYDVDDQQGLTRLQRELADLQGDVALQQLRAAI